MLALASRHQIDLPTSWGECSGILSAHAEENHLCDIAKIEPHATAI